jgi:hypothetical protein
MENNNIFNKRPQREIRKYNSNVLFNCNINKMMIKYYVVGIDYELFVKEICLYG